MQRLIGSPYIQAKLQISTPGDPFEQEADRVADTVMRMTVPEATGNEANGKEATTQIQPKPVAPQISRRVQRAPEQAGEEEEEETEPVVQRAPLAVREDDDEEKIATKPNTGAFVQRLCTECEAEKEPVVHRKCAATDDVEEIQPSGTQTATPKVTSSVASNIHAMNGGGRPLPATTRAFFEPRFSADLSQVRVHTDSRAATTAKSIQARAFTVGSNIAFGPGQFAPESHEGKHLLAHELTHVVQQSGSGVQRASLPISFRSAQGAIGQPTIQRAPLCPDKRDTDEITKSQAPAGVLAVDTSFNAAKESLSVQDFGIDQPNVRPTMTETDDWRRMMSMILGDPTVHVAVLGYSDCLGTEQNNKGLRARRADAVIKAMPAEAQAKVSPLLKGWWGSLTYLFPNDTAENRARNRMVLIALLRSPTDSCDALAAATNMDQFIFLVTCVEKRLNLTNAADAPKTLSLLRQIFFGNAPWSTQRNRSKAWDDVIPTKPWSPGDDPTPKLGPKLLTALQNSKKVKFDNSPGSTSVEISHMITGLDAMMKPQNTAFQVGPVSLQTSITNHALATWAGDVASAATNYTICVDFLKYSASYDDFFKDLAEDADLEGDVDAYAAWAAQIYSSPTATVPLPLNLPMSELLMQYYRLKQTAGGIAREQRFEVFANFYNANVQGKKMQDRLAFQQNIAPTVWEVALLSLAKQMKEVLQGNRTSLGKCAGGKAPAPTGQPPQADLATLLADLATASLEMIERFTAWLEKRL